MGCFTTWPLSGWCWQRPQAAPPARGESDLPRGGGAHVQSRLPCSRWGAVQAEKIQHDPVRDFALTEGESSCRCLGYRSGGHPNVSVDSCLQRAVWPVLQALLPKRGSCLYRTTRIVANWSLVGKYETRPSARVRREQLQLKYGVLLQRRDDEPTCK